MSSRLQGGARRTYHPGRLIELGVVERRDVPPASLVRLVVDNLAARAVESVPASTDFFKSK